VARSSGLPDSVFVSAEHGRNFGELIDISVGGAVVQSTPVNPNSFNATFAGPFTIMLTDGTALDLQSSDKDDPGSEVIYDCPIPMVTASLLRTRYVQCSGVGGGTINYTIKPAE